jgi:hypothetical protein
MPLLCILSELFLKNPRINHDNRGAFIFPYFLSPCQGEGNDPGLTQNLRHCERSEAIQTCRHGNDWIATPPPEARNDDVRKPYDLSCPTIALPFHKK